MVGHCSVYDCLARKVEINDLMHHSFPVKDPHRVAKWVEFCARSNDPWFEPANKRICSLHFAPVAYVKRKGRLTDTALPTIKPKTLEEAEIVMR